MGGSVSLDSDGRFATHFEREDEDTLKKISPPTDSTCRASGTSQQSNADSVCERSSDEDTNENDSSVNSSDDELYSRDSVSNLDQAREILQTLHFLPKVDDFDSDEEKEPPRPESPLTFEPSEEYKAIEASSVSWALKIDESLQNAHLDRLAYAESKRRDHASDKEVEVED